MAHDESPPSKAGASQYADRTGPRKSEDYLTGDDIGLEPVFSLDLSRCTSFSALLSEMRHTSFGGRQLGEAADILHEMVADPDCLVVGTFSGAMTVAKQGLILCDMIDHGMLDAVVSTGALMTHGLVEATGMTHFKVPHDLADRDAFYAGFDRVYDTLELEQNLDDLEHIVDGVLNHWPAGQVASSHTVCEAIGRHLRETLPEGRGILQSALARGIPVFIPAFTDSELGLDFALANRRRAAKGGPHIAFDPFVDLDHYAELCQGAKRMGIFTIGGGVPRNWAQQVAPYLDLVATRAEGRGGALHRFRYGVRVCPEPVHWGGLSGCTYSEGVSWGKFVPLKDGGRFAEVPADATVVWPLLVAGVLQRLREGVAAG